MLARQAYWPGLTSAKAHGLCDAPRHPPNQPHKTYRQTAKRHTPMLRRHAAPPVPWISGAAGWLPTVVAVVVWPRSNKKALQGTRGALSCWPLALKPTGPTQGACT
jgi:hypothetical protein